ncbi:COMM domain-containing protein 3-like [Gigantopelta aegis]|uniref:COMM domain-containing protein 3-like n=1 Tax=Gigantopelta aegis TaxID=1735272 RepID=UPI001B88E6F9|nr:COMM domain-containing protein 3-like [Gigantopelta aegis]
MELANSVLENLTLAGDDVRIPAKCFNVLVTRACQGVLDVKHRDVPETDPAVKDVDKATLKAAYSGLVTTILEAAKHDCEAAATGSLLEECKFSPDRINTFNNIFMSQKQYIQILLGSIGRSPPHIVDVDWRLDYYIKNNHLEKVNEPVYLVCLKTEVPESSEIKDIQFSCSLEQLQDFVGKLKDATKCLEKIGQL